MYDTYGAMWQNVATRAGASRDSDVARIKDYTLQALINVWRRFHWPERLRTKEIFTVATISGLKCSWTNGSETVTRIEGPAVDSAWVGRWISPGWRAPYKILSVAGDDITVHRKYYDETAEWTSPVYVTEIDLPEDVAEILEQDIQLLYGTGSTLGYMSESNARRASPFPRQASAPLWWSPGRRSADQAGVDSIRSLNVGPHAPDKIYTLSVNYYCHYPPLNDDPDTDATPIWIPEERRELVVWNALARAYSEHPFTDTTQAEKFEALYEKNLHIALNAHKEEAGEVEYVRGYDEYERAADTGVYRRGG